MSHRPSALSWWPFSGYSGLESGLRVSLPNSIIHFSLRFFIFYIIILVLWIFIHSYYEAILWFFTIKASHFFGQTLFTNPEIINDEYVCQLGGSSMFRYNFSQSFPLSIFITIPLLLSTPSIPSLNRVKITMIGLIFLLLFQASCLLIILYNMVYQNYSLWLQKGIEMEQIITYNPAKAEVFSWLTHFLNKFLKFPVAVGIWIGLVSYYKRSVKQHWIRKLL